MNYFCVSHEAWAKLRGDDDFKNLDSAKIRHWVSVVVAEILGTAILVGIGCSSMHIEITEVGSIHATILNIMLSFAFAVVVVVTAFCHISGAHVNPAISLASLMHGQISIPAFFLYVVSQLIGAILGTAAIKLISPDNCTLKDFCVTIPTSSVGAVRGTICEAYMVAVLTLVVCAAWDRRCRDKQDSMAIKLGITIVAVGLPGAKFTGASLNPARSFGPALLAGNFTDHWVYWVGPLSGSFLAVIIYKAFLAEIISPQAHRTQQTQQAQQVQQAQQAQQAQQGQQARKADKVAPLKTDVEENHPV